MAPDFAARYRAPAWLPGGDLQTIWAATRARRHRGAPPRYARERWDTPDGDFIDVDHLAEGAAGPDATHLVLFHGLEGSSASQYAQAFACIARERGWRYSVPHFRGCSGALNRAPRAYHSGDHAEIDWILRRLRERGRRPLRVVGVSLGGNALLRWAEEQGTAAAAVAGAIAALSAPLDLTAAGAALDRGINRLLYARMFLATMKPRALAKLELHPGLFDAGRLRAATTIRAFDDAFTAPVHGYRDAADYWARASAKPQLARLRLPTLLLNARNDPFVPAASLPGAADVNGRVTLWQPAQGGHVGFPQGAPPGHVLAMPAAVADWLAGQG
ncbi:MAG: alpha/beta fold hydrolase [Burkholderiales bacterium]|nr:alpha/beta fold hydrolase [Burkholderiales bacterium]MDE1926449.1 alpha/beta fold hydrolase [Burkholderiales bacterium]MDE2161081.1 alpha/beta fold hydrolase [Burkholderiales bacterium]MDE2503015.1 alpha/beta fold hydrolase [Burkholderiales bacterium]